jgi:hypothetical protein
MLLLLLCHNSARPSLAIVGSKNELIVESVSLSAGSYIEVLFPFPNGFVYVASPSIYHTKAATCFNPRGEQDCTWYETTEQGVILVGTRQGIVRIFANKSGLFVITVGTLSSSCCYSVLVTNFTLPVPLLSSKSTPPCIISSSIDSTLTITNETVPTSSSMLIGFAPGVRRAWTYPDQITGNFHAVMLIHEQDEKVKFKGRDGRPFFAFDPPGADFLGLISEDELAGQPLVNTDMLTLKRFFYSETEGKDGL